MTRRGRGFTLAEVLVSSAIFLVALAILGATFTASRNLLSETSGSSTVTQKIRKAYLSLEEDLRGSSLANLDIALSPAAPGAGAAGDALWFLSARDLVSGRTVGGLNGRPLWQRNVLYYPTVPTDHDSLYGVSCAGGSDADGYDVHCPHKALVRKVIDSGVITTPSSPDNIERLLTAADILPFLTPTTGFNVSAGGTGMEEGGVLVPGLLTFRVSRPPISDPLANQVSFTLQVTSLEGLGKTTAIGSVDLASHPKTETTEFSIFQELP